MRRITYSLEFTGRATTVAPGELRARMRAGSCALVTTVDSQGVRGRFEEHAGEEALMEAQLAFSSEALFQEEGSVAFGRAGALHFRSFGMGVLDGSGDGCRHATVVLEVDGGEGRLEGARGRISSHLSFGDGREVRDTHFGVIYLQGAE